MVSLSRHSKTQFLEKVISCVYFTIYPGKRAGDIPVNISSLKIIANEDPERTNVFLQLLAIAATEFFQNSREATVRVLRGDRVQSRQNDISSDPLTPRMSVDKDDLKQCLVLSSDKGLCSGMDFAEEKRPVEGLRLLLADHHPFPDSGEIITLVSRLLLWKSSTSVLASTSEDQVMSNFN
jgi:hypothetical protein